MTIDPALDLALRAALSLLLVAAAIHKVRDLRTFRATLAEYRLLPAPTVNVGAAGIAAAELALAVGLHIAPREALVGTAALLVVYAGAIAINLARGRRDLDCGCGGARRTISGELVARNMTLAALAVAGLLPPSPRAITWLDAITVAAVTAFAAAVYATVDRMIADAPALTRVRGLA
jgi:Methylamine utilisation protein MauE